LSSWSLTFELTGSPGSYRQNEARKRSLPGLSGRAKGWATLVAKEKTMAAQATRRAVAAIAVVGKIDGHDVIRRDSALDMVQRHERENHPETMAVPLFTWATVEAAVAAERERCAKLCEAYLPADPYAPVDQQAAGQHQMAEHLASLIRDA
jgi:hypothetical protein